MIHRPTPKLAAAIVAALVLLPLGVTAQSDTPLKPVTLDETANTVEAALISISKQAGFGLVMTASKADLEKPLTLIIAQRPAEEVLDIIKTSTNLELEMKAGILYVRSKTPPVPVGAASKGDNAAKPAAEKDDSSDRPSWAKHWKWGKRRNKRVEFGGPVVVGKDEHLHSAVSIGGITTVYGHLDKDAVSVGGQVIVKSGAVVEGKAVAVGGDVTVEPGAIVEDETVAVGGKVNAAEGSDIGGDRVSVPIPLPLPVAGGVAGAVGSLVMLHIIGALTRSIVLFAFALLLVWLIPRRVTAVQDYMTRKTGVSMLSGFLVFAAIIPVFIVLAITIIGIPLIPVAAIVLAALIVLGLTGIMTWLGYKTPMFKDRKTLVKALIIGFVVFTLINLIPLLGSLFLLAVTLAGVGAAFQTRFGGRPHTEA